MPSSNFKGRLEMQEDLERISKQLRIDRMKKVREKEQRLAIERSDLYRHFIEESKREKLLEKKRKRATEISNNLEKANNQWSLALTDAGAAHRGAASHIQQSEQKRKETEESERRRQEAAEKRMAYALQKVREEEIKRKHKEREIQILKQLRDQERWAAREDAHAFGETHQVQESAMEIDEKIKLTKQSSESVYHRFPIKITPVVTRHGVTAEEHAVLNHAAEEEVKSRKTVWKNVMCEMQRRRTVKERATQARFKNFRHRSTKQLEDELKILQKMDKAGLRNYRIKETLAVPDEEDEEIDVKMNFEKIFMNVKPEKGYSPSPPGSRAASRDEGEKSFLDDASYRSMFEDNQNREMLQRNTSKNNDAFWVNFQSQPETDAPWTPSMHSNNVSTDSATSVPEEDDGDESDEDEPIRTIIPNIPHPAPIAWPGSRRTQPPAQRPQTVPSSSSSSSGQRSTQQQTKRTSYVVESPFAPFTDEEQSSPDTSSLLVDEAEEATEHHEIVQTTTTGSNDVDHLLLDKGNHENQTSFKPFATTTGTTPSAPNSNTLANSKASGKRKEAIVFDDSELSNESIEQKNKDSIVAAAAGKRTIVQDVSSASASSASTAQTSDSEEALAVEPAEGGVKRGHGQRLPSMSSLGASTQTSDLTKRSDNTNTSDFEDVLVITPGKAQQQHQQQQAPLLSYPSLSSSSANSSVSSPSISPKVSPTKRVAISSVVQNSMDSLQSSDQSIASMPSTSSSKLSDLHDAMHTVDDAIQRSQQKKLHASTSTSSSPASSLSSAEVAKYQKYLAASDSPLKRPASTDASSAVSPYRQHFPERFIDNTDQDNEDDEDDMVLSPWKQTPVGKRERPSVASMDQSPFSPFPQLAAQSTAAAVPSNRPPQRQQESDSETSIDYRAVAIEAERDVRRELNQLEANRYTATSKYTPASFASTSSSSSASPMPTASSAAMMGKNYSDGAFAQHLTSNILKQVAQLQDESDDDDSMGMDLSAYIPASKRTQNVSGLNLSDTMDSLGEKRTTSSTIHDRLLMPSSATPVSRSSSHDQDPYTHGNESTQRSNNLVGLSVSKPVAPSSSSTMQHIQTLAHQSSAAALPQMPAKSAALSPPPHPLLPSSSAAPQLSSTHPVLHHRQQSQVPPAAAAHSTVTWNTTTTTTTTDKNSSSSRTAAAITEPADSDSSAELDRHIAHLSLNVDTSSNVSQRLLQSSNYNSSTSQNMTSTNISNVLLRSQTTFDEDSDDDDDDMDEDSISGGSSQHILSNITNNNSNHNNNNRNNSLLSSTIMTTSTITRSDRPSRSSNNATLDLDSSSSSSSFLSSTNPNMQQSGTPSASFLTGDGDQPSYLYTASNATLSEIQHEIYDMRRRLLQAVSYPQAPASQTSLLNASHSSSASSSPESNHANTAANIFQPTKTYQQQQQTSSTMPPSSSATATSTNLLRSTNTAGTMVFDEDMSSDDSLIHFENEIKRRKEQQQQEMTRKQQQRQQQQSSYRAAELVMDSSLEENEEDDSDLLMLSTDRKQASDDLLLTEQSLSSQSTPRKYRVDHVVITSTSTSSAASSHHPQASTYIMHQQAMQQRLQQQQNQQQNQQQARQSYISSSAQQYELDNHSSSSSEDSDTFTSMLLQQQQQQQQRSSTTHSNTTSTAAAAVGERRVTISDANNIYHSPPASMILSEQSLSLSSPTAGAATTTTTVEEESLSQAPTPRMSHNSSSGAYSPSQTQSLSSTTPYNHHIAPSAQHYTSTDYNHHYDDSSDLDILAALSPAANAQEQDPLAMTQRFTRPWTTTTTATATTTNRDATSRQAAALTSSSTLRHYSQAFATDFTSMLRSQQPPHIDAGKDDYDPLEHEQVLFARRDVVYQHDVNRQRRMSGNYDKEEFEKEDSDEDDAAFERDLQRTLNFIRGDRGSGARAGRTSAANHRTSGSNYRTRAAAGEDSEEDLEESSFDLLEEQSF